MSVTVQLSEPLSTHKGSVTSLELKEPRYREFRRFGNPFRSIIGKDGSVEVIVDQTVMGDFIAAMTGVDTILLESLTATDWKNVSTAAGFLINGVAGGNPPNTQDDSPQ